ncbi:MAG: acetylglutamate kinase [Deltaproteobacteria bacterium]|nr:acetylglutamate kinase [Deltaproteobacteria bacterium]
MTKKLANKIFDLQKKTETLIEMLPYVTEFSGKRVLIKVGGEILEDMNSAKSFCQDIILLRALGLQVVLCHGGGPQITKLMKSMNKEAVFVRGQRVTDAETLDLTAMVLLGNINRTLVSLLNTFGKRAVGMSGVDARLFVCRAKDPALGFVGEICSVSARPIMNLLNNNYLPVVASLGMDNEGNNYNINADTAAGELAKAIGAQKLILLTNVEGIYENFEDKSSLISELDEQGLRELLAGGTLAAGMIPKVESILTALSGGVPHAHILDGRIEHAVLLEIFTAEGIGTMVRRGPQTLVD